MGGFEGSFLGRGERLGGGDRLECGVCWWVYNPERGDPVWQIPPGTPFSALPDHWRCPNCDAAAQQFMVLEADMAPRVSEPGPSAGERDLEQLRGVILDGYRRVAAKMRPLAVYNAHLDVAVPALCRCEQGQVAVLVTPWCMNLMLFSEGASSLREGSTREHRFPSGEYVFTASFLDGVGAFESCSLFSPMDAFDAQEVALAVARETLTELLRAEDKEPGEGDETVDSSKRRILGMRPAP
jgi:[NiFe] hydrogenase assembly HybE family chaperone